MVLSSLRRLFGDNTSGARRPRTDSRVRLVLDALEDRVVPSTLEVGTGPKDYHTIQAAVSAASPGDTIKVDPGTYNEQVTISTSNLTLKGSNGKSIIQGGGAATTTTYNATIEVDGAHNVTIDGFTIENQSGVANSGGNLNGIAIVNGGSATITNDHITQVEDTNMGASPDGVQEGNAILVGQDYNASTATTGTATISHDTIDNYQKRGIEVGGAGSDAEIDHTTVTGVGPTSVIGQNGIEVVLGGNADITHNTISGNVYTGGGGGAAGILLYQSGAVTADHNMISQNDVGIYVYGPAGETNLQQNQISNSTQDGIDLDSVSGAYLSQNQVSNSGVNGIALFDGSTGNFLDQNQSRNNDNDGIFVASDSTGNTINQSQLQKNGNLDAEDDSAGSGTAGTGNTWTKNHGKTSNPAGLVS